MVIMVIIVVMKVIIFIFAALIMQRMMKVGLSCHPWCSVTTSWIIKVLHRMMMIIGGAPSTPTCETGPAAIASRLGETGSIVIFIQNVLYQLFLASSVA